MPICAGTGRDGGNFQFSILFVCCSQFMYLFVLFCCCFVLLMLAIVAATHSLIEEIVSFSILHLTTCHSIGLLHTHAHAEFLKSIRKITIYCFAVWVVILIGCLCVWVSVFIHTYYYNIWRQIWKSTLCTGWGIQFMCELFERAPRTHTPMPERI